MRILHLDTERSWRGGERQLWLLAKELSGSGHTNWVACRRGSPLARQSASVQLPVCSVNPWNEMDPLSAWRLRRFLTDNQVDILHAHTAHAVSLGALAVQRTPVRFVATRRVDFPLKKNFWTRWKYSRLDKWVAISRNVRDVLAESGAPPDRVEVVLSGIDPTDYPSVSQRNEFRRRRGFSETDRLVVQVGALVPHKDPLNLVEAAAGLCLQNPFLQVLFLGDGPLKRAILKRVTELGLEGRVRLLGHRDDALDHIAMSDVFVLGSVEEGLGTSILDALAIGVPVVATRAGGIPEIFGSSDAPELVSPRRPAELAEHIVRVLDDEPERRRRVARGRDIAARFSSAAMARRYEQIYREVLHE